MRSRSRRREALDIWFQILFQPCVSMFVCVRACLCIHLTNEMGLLSTVRTDTNSEKSAFKAPHMLPYIRSTNMDNHKHKHIHNRNEGRKECTRVSSSTQCGPVKEAN